MTISERIRHTRQARKLSQTELATQTGINRKTLNRYELGGVPPADALKAIADAARHLGRLLTRWDAAEIHDRDLHEKFKAIQHVDPDTKAIVDNFLDLIIRDAKAREAYA